MVRVKKRSEEFDQAKLKASLEEAGAKEEHATRVAEAVTSRVWEGMTTDEIRQLATTELKKLDQQAATTYETFRK